MNKYIGIGRLTKDGELRTTESKINIYNNTLAIKNTFKNKDGNYDSEFINFVAYRNDAEFLSKYASKGDMIQIEGRLHTRSYDDKENIKRFVTEVIVENASIIQKKKVEDTKEIEVPTNTKSEYQEKEIVLENSDLPF